ncbi:MAG: hypothetical protein IJK98_11920, partial [Clostridia bacterium]|nr:hypothetical protein [Clostridia bacterium]
YYDNIPVAPAFALGADEAVVVDLKTDNNHEGYLRHPRVKYIKPTRDLGTFMNFEREVLDRSMRLGYDDTMKVYGRYYGSLYTLIPQPEADYREIAATFITLLTQMEAAYDFSGTVRFQRINKVPGCTALLADRCPRGKEDELHMFLAALELYLKLIGRDDAPEYDLDQLLYELKAEVYGMYPMLEFDAQDAFARVKAFAAEKAGKHHPELKRFEEPRYAIIVTAVVRTLQQTRYGGGTNAPASPAAEQPAEPMPSAIFAALERDGPGLPDAAREKEEETV